MNAFRILDEKGSPVTMGCIDKVAAEFWNKEVCPKRYATPYKAADESAKERMREAISTNWVDMIGRAIANQGTTLNSWDNVVITMTAGDTGEAVMFYHKPYVELIREFERRGWTPEQVIQG